ncbi:hypothetical protein vseg_009768 [Gypsophila vaccaria]
MNEKRMRGSKIPGFGNWDHVNELPITQYFECARQAGLVRYSSSRECGHTYNNCSNDSVDYNNYGTNPPTKQTKGRMKKTGRTGTREDGKNKEEGKVFGVTVTELPKAHVAKRAVKKKQHESEYDVVLSNAPKAVDEDLYKIPPELLKKKKRLGFFSRCLVPPCAV